MIKVPKDKLNIPAPNQLRQRLQSDFNNKCCYCETSHIKGEIEHFLPKSKFPLLENEWENLLWACHDCNNMKGDKHDDAKPILNPTVDEPETVLEFDLRGNMYGIDEKAQNSISTIALNRTNLCDNRKEVIDEFVRNLEFLSQVSDKESVKNYIVQHFIHPVQSNPNLSYIAFRKCIIQHYLTEILSSL